MDTASRPATGTGPLPWTAMEGPRHGDGAAPYLNTKSRFGSICYRFAPQAVDGVAGAETVMLRLTYVDRPLGVPAIGGRSLVG